MYNEIGDIMEKYCTKCVYSTLPKHHIEYKENDVIFLEGDILENAFLIESGLVKVSKLFLNGEERIFDILGPDEFLALVAILRNDDSYVASATCLTSVTLGKVSKTDVLEAYNSSSKFKDVCLSCIVTRTNLFQNHLYQSSNVDKEDKIMSVFEYLAKKFGKKIDGKHVLDLPFSKTNLANIIGIRRETLSRKLSKMQKENILEINKNKYIFTRM